MARPKFTKDSEEFTFSRSRRFPKEDPLKFNIVTNLSAGGEMYAYDKGIAEQFINLTFKGLTETDKDNILYWWESVAVGAKNTFTFTDEDSVAYTVRWIDQQLVLRREEANTNLYSVTIRLRVEV